MVAHSSLWWGCSRVEKGVVVDQVEVEAEAATVRMVQRRVRCKNMFRAELLQRAAYSCCTLC